MYNNTITTINIEICHLKAQMIEEEIKGKHHLVSYIKSLIDEHEEAIEILNSSENTSV